MKSWDKYLVNDSLSTLEVMRTINEMSLGFVVVVAENGRLKGTITDGDIRRAILAGKDLNKPAKEVMNCDPFVVNADYDSVKVRKMCLKQGITFVPVVDANGNIISILTSSDLVFERKSEFPVVIMAGGLGSRLGDLTKNCPKPMIKVGEKPILEILLYKLKEQGFSEIYLCVNYLHEQIQEYFGDGERLGLKIEYVVENNRMGTAGALSLLKERLNKPFIVTNADIITDVNFNHMIDFFNTGKVDAIVGVRTYEVEIPFGVIKAKDKRFLGIEEKPRVPYMVSAGIYVMTPKLIEHISPDTYLDMPDFLEKIVSEKKVVNVFPIHENWIDVGRTSDLILATKEIN